MTLDAPHLARAATEGEQEMERQRGNTAFVWLDFSAARSARCSQTRQPVHLPCTAVTISLREHAMAGADVFTPQILPNELAQPPRTPKRPRDLLFRVQLRTWGSRSWHHHTTEAEVSGSWSLGLTWLVLSCSLLSRNIFSKAKKVRKPAMTHRPSCCCCCRLRPSPPAEGSTDRPGRARPIEGRPFAMGPSQGRVGAGGTRTGWWGSRVPGTPTGPSALRL